MTGGTLAHLSGGMDSTAVALIASRLASTEPVHTASLVYERLPKLAAERPYVEAAISRAPGAICHRILADDVLDFDAFADAPRLDEPASGLWRMGLDRLPLRLAVELGLGSVLSGIGADEVTAIHPHHLADLVRRGRYLSAWREAGRWAAARNCGRWDILSQFSLAGLPSWLGWLSMYRAGTALARQTDDSLPPWLTPEFARRCQDEHPPALPRGISPAIATAIESLRGRAGDVLRWSEASAHGIRVSHPFLDPRVAAVGLGAVARLPAEPGAQKPLLAAAVGDLLPAEVTGRRAKGHFDELYYLGLNRNRERLAALIRRAPAECWELFDRGRLLSAVDEACLAGAGARPLQRLALSLSLIHWLSARAGWMAGELPPVTEDLEITLTQAEPVGTA